MIAPDSLRGHWKMMENDKKPNNLRTALILFSIALVFFIGVIVKQTLLR
jgi:hypothetical protein